MKAVSTAIFLRVVTKILMCTIRELSLGLGLFFSIERYKYIWETIIHMPCVWNTFSGSDHNSNFIFSYYVTIFLDLMKFFRCDMVFRTLMGRTDTVCFDNYEQIWICKTLSPKQIMEEVDCLMEELEKYENKPFDIQNTLNASMNTSVSIV